MRQILLSPGTSLELWLRTRYHKMKATRLAFRIMDLIAHRSYRRWRAQYLNQPYPNVKFKNNNILVTFILSVKNNPVKEVEKTINSIKRLSLNDWEIIMSGKHVSCPEIFKSWTNEKNIHWANFENDNFIKEISGDYVIFCQSGDIFFEGLLNHFFQDYQNKQEADIFYYDCEYYNQDSKRWMPFFKPGKVSPALFLSTNMLSRGMIKLSKLEDIWSSLDLKRDWEAIEYEICLKLYENKAKFEHIPTLLISQFSLATSQSHTNAEVILEHLSRKGFEGVSLNKSRSLPRFTWNSGNPSISIIIPTKNNRRYLEQLFNSINETTNNINLSITIVDNNTQDPETLDFYGELEKDKKINLVHYDQPFNYSEAINLGVSHTDTDLVLLMNDDMLIRNKEWLPEVIQWASRPEVGLVGAKLLRANHTIQHAGVILGLLGLAGHIYLNAPEHYIGFLGSVDWYRNFLAVTGAFQMMRREIFDKVGGYNLEYQLAFGDIDFCLRVYQAGYQIIYTPFAQIYHYEGSSRGYKTPVPDLMKGFEDMRDYLINGDPYFSPHLSHTWIPECLMEKESKDERIIQLEERKKYYSKLSD